MYIIRNMLGVTLTVILSPEKHLICKPDLISHFVGNAEHASQTPMWPCEPWLALMLDLPGRALKWSDEWAPVSCHSLGGPEAIQLSAALPALTMMNTRQAADNTSNNYKINFKKKEKKEIGGKRYDCHHSMFSSPTLPSEELPGEQITKSVYAIIWNRTSNILQPNSLKLSVRLLRCTAFLLSL